MKLFRHTIVKLALHVFSLARARVLVIRITVDLANGIYS